MNNVHPPYCIDIDGTYLKTDLLLETLLICIKRNPLIVFILPYLLLKGRGYLKSYLAQRALPFLNINGLPTNKQLAELLKQKRSDGADIYLVSASNEELVKVIAKKENYSFYASSESLNLKGKKKAEFLEKLFPAGFIYAGNSYDDIPVWQKAKAGIITSNDKNLIKKAKLTNSNIEVISAPRPVNKIKVWGQQLRLYQTIKNLLIFVPLALVHKLTDWENLSMAISGFILLSVVASATYIANDLLDLNQDRSHWIKSLRPLASGEITIMHGVIVFLMLSITSLTLGFYLNTEFGFGLLIYFITTLSYSLYFKKITLLDIIILASLYTLRLVLGAVLIDVDNSVWLLSFSYFLFISLTLVKRVTELKRMKDTTNSGRGYKNEDLPFLANMGISSGIGAIILMLLYLLAQQYENKGYAYPKLLWGIPVCIFLIITKIWLETMRNKMRDDPIIFTVTNKFCLIVTAIAALLFFAAGGGI